MKRRYQVQIAAYMYRPPPQDIRTPYCKMLLTPVLESRWKIERRKPFRNQAKCHHGMLLGHADSMARQALSPRYNLNVDRRSAIVFVLAAL